MFCQKSTDGDNHTLYGFRLDDIDLKNFLSGTGNGRNNKWKTQQYTLDENPCKSVG